MERGKGGFAMRFAAFIALLMVLFAGQRLSGHAGQLMSRVLAAIFALLLTQPPALAAAPPVKAPLKLNKAIAAALKKISPS
jgi:integral membrane sensor domain MASE1